MIGYVTVGTNDFAAAAKYYDELFAVIGAKRMMSLDAFVAWSTERSGPAFSISKPFDRNPATVGNGVMVAIGVDDSDTVDAFHAKAIDLGSVDEGAPGLRGDNFYAGYFRDIDGNKLNAFCWVTK